MNHNLARIKIAGKPSYRIFTPVSGLKEARYVLEVNAAIASKDELIELCKQLLKTAVRDWALHGNILSNICKTVIDWHHSLPTTDRFKEGTLLMLAEKWLINKVIEDPRTLYILKFKEGENLFLWVVVNKTSAEIELEYSSYFAECLERFDSFYCDYMVFSEDEINNLTLPHSVQVIRT